MLKSLIISGLCLVGLSIQGQRPSLHFDRVTVENGLSNNQVNCIIQDSRGFTWIGTNDGLNRYDGNYFLIYRNRPGDSTSLSGNMITDMLEDEQGIIWITTSDGGLTRYNYRLAPELQFHQYKQQKDNPASIPTNSINKIAADKNGYLWLASNGFAIIRFSKRTGQFDRPVQSGPRTVLDLAFDQTGILWAGRQGGGIMKINPSTLKATYDPRYEDLYARLPHVVVTSLLSSSRNKMYYGSWDRFLYEYDHATGIEKVYGQLEGAYSFINDEITDFIEDKKGYIWIGGKTRGLQLMDPGNGKFYQYQHNPAQEGSLPDNNIRCIYLDRDGRTWIGTMKGVCVTNPAQQQFNQTFLTSATNAENPVMIYDFFRDENGQLYIGTSNGIYVQDYPTGPIIHKPLFYKGIPLAVTKFFKSASGIFYIGTNYSLFIFDPVSNTVRLLENTEKDKVMNRIIESRITSIAETVIDGNPALMVSPYGHFIAYYDLVKRQWVSRLDSSRKILEKYNLRDYLVRKLFKASDGKIWVANTREGLGEWNIAGGFPVKFHQNDPGLKEGLSNNNIYDIIEDNRKNLWISTYGGGLHYMETRRGKITHIPSTSNLLEGISQDGRGNVWIVTNGNLQRYDLRSRSGSSFALPDLEKSGGVAGLIYKDADGMMYVAGRNYFIQFNPDSIKNTRAQPTVHVTNFKIFNQSYSNLIFDKKIWLGYRQNYFTLEFSAPEYSSSSPVQYSYILEGWDDTWVHNGTRNFATYSNLEGGTYTFRVRATNNPGTWSEQEERITIVIVPPYWKQWWFYVLCGLLTGALIYLLYRYRIKELVKRQAIRNKIAQDLHDSVGSTLSSISVYSQVAKIYKEKNQEQELQNTLEKISNTSGEMISEMNDIVWTINPRNDSMDKIFQRMESFAKPLLQTKGISFRFRYDESLLQLNLPMEKRKNFYLIFKEAINNVLKYAECRNLEVVIQMNNRNVELLVTDDGNGFDPAEMSSSAAKSLSGNGLNNMKRRAAEMKGHCIINSVPGKGTTIMLVFPIT